MDYYGTLRCVWSDNWLAFDFNYPGHLIYKKYFVFAGIALSDSPTGLLAFELTFGSWLNRPTNVHLYDGGLFEQFERDVVLDEITVYWFTNCIGTAGRIFAESLNWRVYETGLYA